MRINLVTLSLSLLLLGRCCSGDQGVGDGEGEDGQDMIKVSKMLTIFVHNKYV